MVSRPQKSEAAGRLTIGPDLEADRSTRGAAAGTTISVRDIFSRQPARRKFLRIAGSEGSAVASVVSHYALAYPEVRFSLKMDGRQGLSTTGSGDLRDAVAAVYGTEVAASMLPVNPGEGTIEVRGLTGPPHVSRSGRGYISLFVNRRWIQDRRLTYAVEQAYQGMLMVGRHPLSVLNIRLPHEEVDVNVHPAKVEVRFRDESAVFGAVQKAVRRALLDASPVPGAYVGGGAEAPALSSGAQSFPGRTSPLWQHALQLERRPSSVAADALELAGSPSVTLAQVLPVLRVIGQFGAIYNR